LVITKALAAETMIEDQMLARSGETRAAIWHVRVCDHSIEANEIP
jgi:hypothetical protein